MRMLRGVSAGVVSASFALAAFGCETKSTPVGSAGFTRDGRATPSRFVMRDEKGNVIKQGAPVKRERVNVDDSGKVKDAINFDNRPAAKPLPQVMPFGELKADSLNGVATPATQKGELVSVETLPPVRVLSKLVFQGWAGRGSAPASTSNWGRGTELMPPQDLVPGKAKTSMLGTTSDGGMMAYEVEAADKRKRVPIKLTLTLWGSKSLRRTWTALLAPGELQTFDMRTRQGEQVKIEVTLEGAAGEETGQQLYEEKRTKVEP